MAEWQWGILQEGRERGYRQRLQLPMNQAGFLAAVCSLVPSISEYTQSLNQPITFVTEWFLYSFHYSPATRSCSIKCSILSLLTLIDSVLLNFGFKSNIRNTLNNTGRKSVDCPFSLIPEPGIPWNQTFSNLKPQLHRGQKFPFTSPPPLLHWQCSDPSWAPHLLPVVS